MPTLIDEKDVSKPEEQPQDTTCATAEPAKTTDEPVVVVTETPIETVNPEVKAEEAKTEDKPEVKRQVQGLSELLRNLKKASKALSPAERQLRVKFSVMSWDDTASMESFAECLSGVLEMSKSGKMTLDAIIDKGLQCPCPRHSAAKVAAEMLKQGWIGEA